MFICQQCGSGETEQRFGDIPMAMRCGVLPMWVRGVTLVSCVKCGVELGVELRKPEALFQLARTSVFSSAVYNERLETWETTFEQ